MGLSGQCSTFLTATDVEAATRVVAMMLDGLMMGLAAVDSPEALQLSRRAWVSLHNVMAESSSP